MSRTVSTFFLIICIALLYIAITAGYGFIETMAIFFLAGMALIMHITFKMEKL